MPCIPRTILRTNLSIIEEMDKPERIKKTVPNLHSFGSRRGEDIVKAELLGKTPGVRERGRSPTSWTESPNEDYCQCYRDSPG